MIIHIYCNSLVTNHCIFFCNQKNNINTDKCNDEANIGSVNEFSQKKQQQYNKSTVLVFVGVEFECTSVFKLFCLCVES